MKMLNKVIGLNTKIYMMGDENGTKLALKIYKKKTANDERNRAKAEIQFLRYTKEIGCRDVPKLINYSIEENWSLIEWLDGKKPKGYNGEIIQEMINFIKKINQQDEEKKATLEKASEAITDYTVLSNTIKHRLNKLNTIKPKNDIERDTERWINEYLIEYARKSQEKTNYAGREWLDEDIGTMVSPSDMGLHNMIEQNRIKFIDFEYAGRDDFSKLASDIILHPDHQMKEKEKLQLLKGMLKIEGVNNSWYTRMNEIMHLSKTKWILIMLKPYIEGNIDYQRLAKIKRYYKECRID